MHIRPHAAEKAWMRKVYWMRRQLIYDGQTMSNEKITYRLYAVQRMIEEYPDDTPYPSRLILGCYKGRLIHVVAANNCLDEEIIIITVYEPDPTEWDMKCRKRI